MMLNHDEIFEFRVSKGSYSLFIAVVFSIPLLNFVQMIHIVAKHDRRYDHFKMFQIRNDTQT